MEKVKKHLLTIILNSLLLIGIVFCIVLYYRWSHMHESQNMAQRWAGESTMLFSQVSAFFPNDSALGISDVHAFHSTVESRLKENSLEAELEGSLFLDAYSVMGEMTVARGRISSQVTAIGVGGDFFSFHPLRLRGGAYFSGSDLMQDKVVLDEELAWKLFGSYDVAGLEITVDNMPHVIAGVIARDKDFATSKAFPIEASMYVSFETMQKSNADAGITSYEIVMPNPISGFAYNIMEEAFSAQNGIFVENTGRFRPIQIAQMLRHLGERSMGTTGVIYPYWENAARVTEDYLTLLIVCIIFLSLIPLYTVVRLLAALLRTLKSKKKVVKQLALDAYEKRNTRLREKDTAKKEKQTSPQMSRNRQKEPAKKRISHASPPRTVSSQRGPNTAPTRKSMVSKNTERLEQDIDRIVSEILKEKNDEDGSAYREPSEK